MHQNGVLSNVQVAVCLLWQLGLSRSTARSPIYYSNKGCSVGSYVVELLISSMWTPDIILLGASQRGGKRKDWISFCDRWFAGSLVA